MAQIWHKLAQIGTKPPILDFIAAASYSVVMSIDDHPARANHAHNQKAERIAKRAEEKLTGGKDYPVEDFENAEGIASVLELKIQEARINFEQRLEVVKKAQSSLKDRYEKEQEHKLKFAKGISEATDRINDLYLEIDEIIPIPEYKTDDDKYDQSDFGAVLLEGLSSGMDIKFWSEEKGEYTSDFADKLNTLNYKQTAALVKKQAELKEALELKTTITDWYERRQENNPKEIARKEHELADALFKSGLALQELEKVAAMRSAETKQAIALRNPDIDAEPEEKREADRIAKIAMATAYERGANDEQAFDVWESTFVETLYADELEQDRLSAEDLFEDEEKKAAIAKSEKLKEELKLLRQENEIKDQTIKVFVDAAKDRSDKNPFTIVAERKAWVELKPHPADKIHFQKAKAFLNKMKPSGVIEMYVHDVDWKKEYSTHTRRALALRGGVLVAGNKVNVLVGDPRKANEFECTFPCGTKVVLGLQESHVIPLKYTFGTALHHDPRWTREYENDESLHGVPAGISQQADRTPEELIVHHAKLKANLHRAR